MVHILSNWKVISIAMQRPINQINIDLFAWKETLLQKEGSFICLWTNGNWEENHQDFSTFLQEYFQNVLYHNALSSLHPTLDHLWLPSKCLLNSLTLSNCIPYIKSVLITIWYLNLSNINVRRGPPHALLEYHYSHLMIKICNTVSFI